MASRYDPYADLIMRLINQGVEYSAIARQVGAPSAAAVAGFVHRRLKGMLGDRPPPRRTGPSETPRVLPGAWDEANLTEKWEDRKARRARERELLTKSPSVDIVEAG